MARNSMFFLAFLLISIILSTSYMAAPSEALDCSFYSEEVERSPQSAAGTIVNNRYAKKTSGQVILGPCYDKTNCYKLCDGVVGGFKSDCIDRSPEESVCACCHHMFST